jgi:hypothetical protein
MQVSRIFILLTTGGHWHCPPKNKQYHLQCSTGSSLIASLLILGSSVIVLDGASLLLLGASAPRPELHLMMLEHKSKSKYPKT